MDFYCTHMGLKPLKSVRCCRASSPVLKGCRHFLQATRSHCARSAQKESKLHRCQMANYKLVNVERHLTLGGDQTRAKTEVNITIHQVERNLNFKWKLMLCWVVLLCEYATLCGKCWFKWCQVKQFGTCILYLLVVALCWSVTYSIRLLSEIFNGVSPTFKSSYMPF